MGNFKHGYHKTKIYKAWINMRDRCYNTKYSGFKYYGGRGIKVCKRWQGKNGFIHFLTDMGEPPTEKYALDRVDVNGDYKPSNCKWSTYSEQARNRRSFGTSKYKNVCWNKSINKWVVTFNFGHFDLEEEANKCAELIRKITQGIYE